MEWDAGVPGQTFYHPYLYEDKIENRVIEHDIKTIDEYLKGKETSVPADVLVDKIRDHYLDSSRLIKRALGEKIEDNFQLYNWGLVLTADMGMMTDKLELLIVTYSKKMPKRVTVLDFEEIIHKHTSFRKISAKLRRNRWLELLSSFKMQKIMKPGVPDSIGKKEFKTILEVNDIDIDVDLVRLTKDMRIADNYGNRLHMLLVEDPLISGNFSSKDVVSIKEVRKCTRMKEFENKLAVEEEQYSEFARERAAVKMAAAFQQKQQLDEERTQRVKEKERLRLEYKKQQEDEKSAALARLEQIREEREAIEASKKAEEEKLAIEREEQERQRLQIEAEIRELLAREREMTAPGDHNGEGLEEPAATDAQAQPMPSEEEMVRMEMEARFQEHLRVKAERKAKERAMIARLVRYHSWIFFETLLCRNGFTLLWPG